MEMAQTGKPYAFISYAHKDSDVVLNIVGSMQQDGYNVWYDTGIAPGSSWDDYIATQINNCNCFIAFISNNYLNSANCRDELNYARDNAAHIVLVYLQNVELPSGMKLRLSLNQAINAYTFAHKADFLNKLYTSEGIQACSSKPVYDASSNTETYNLGPDAGYYWESNTAEAPITLEQQINMYNSVPPMVTPPVMPPEEDEDEEPNKLFDIRIICAIIAAVILIIVIVVVVKLSSNKDEKELSIPSSNIENTEGESVAAGETNVSDTIVPSVSEDSAATTASGAATESTTAPIETVAPVSDRNQRFGDYFTDGHSLGVGYTIDASDLVTNSSSPITLRATGEDAHGNYTSSDEGLLVYWISMNYNETVKVTWWHQNSDDTFSEIYSEMVSPEAGEDGLFDYQSYYSKASGISTGCFVVSIQKADGTLTYWEIAMFSS